METTYQTKVYQVSKAIIGTMAISLSLLAICFFICEFAKIPSASLAVILAIILMAALFSPLFYAKRLKAHYTYFANLSFDETAFTCILSKDKTLKNNTYCYKWSEINSYKFYFSAGKYTSLVIYPKIGKRKTFTFWDNKTEKESIENNSIFSIFRNHVKRFNQLNPTEEITLVPNLFATRLGFVILWIITLMAITAIGAHIVKPSKSTIGFLIMGICILIPLWIQRSQNKKFYERMKNLDEVN